MKLKIFTSLLPLILCLGALSSQTILDINPDTKSGLIAIQDSLDKTLFSLHANQSSTGGVINGFNLDSTLTVKINTSSNQGHGRINIYDSLGVDNTIVGPYLVRINKAVELDGKDVNGGRIAINDSLGNQLISMRYQNEGGQILIRDTSGSARINLTNNYNSTGKSRVITNEIEINGGSDLAELFNITPSFDAVEPGHIVSLDPDNSGSLIISKNAYDRKIAGVISGANGIRPGILMGQENSLAYGDHLITLSGRAYVMANATNGAIKIGDRLTSSDIKGEAMKATKRKKSEGAILGKAMSNLESGSGFVLVLIQHN